ncbi:MAG TPA: hypothetical protein DEQ87_19760 [Algoriphagus sp.]|nr:hypothetical protein [Algoriphagus sp.]MAN88309.1 hypothetical protein [Algoriphagus sp.]HAD50429.1 hypothetical protein [Algoriphagus sp.]HAH35254.1 hypothetical protein [Algoriphagus sp.]HAS58774.1 hypothetical protein [Algoriphagus sp.]
MRKVIFKSFKSDKAKWMFVLLLGFSFWSIRELFLTYLCNWETWESWIPDYHFLDFKRVLFTIFSK